MLKYFTFVVCVFFQLTNTYGQTCSIWLKVKDAFTDKTIDGVQVQIFSQIQFSLIHVL